MAFLVSVNQPKFMVSNSISHFSEGTSYSSSNWELPKCFGEKNQNNVICKVISFIVFSKVVDSFMLKSCVQSISHSQKVSGKEEDEHLPAISSTCNSL